MAGPLVVSGCWPGGRVAAGLVVVGAGRVVLVGAVVLGGAALLGGLVLAVVGADPVELVGVPGRGVVGDTLVAGWLGEVRERRGRVEDERRRWGESLVEVGGFVGAGLADDDDADGWCSLARGAGSPGTLTGRVTTPVWARMKAAL